MTSFKFGGLKSTSSDINGETLESAFIFNDNSLDWQVDVGPGEQAVFTFGRDSNLAAA